mgnify:CR=1 FL=1
MTESEVSKAPLDPPDEDELKAPETLDYGDFEDMVTPKTPEEAVEEEPEEEPEEEVTEEVIEDEGEEEPVEEEPEPVEEAVEEAVEEEPALHAVKINGETYNLSTDDLVSGYQQAAASQQKFQRASEVQKAADTVINNVLDPEKTIETMVDLYSDRMGGDREKAAEVVDEIVGKRIQYLIDLEDMSDEERQVHDLTIEKDRMEGELAQHRSEQQKVAHQEQINYQNNQAVPLLDAAISKYNLQVGSAEDKEASQRLAEYIRQGHTVTQDIADRTVAEVANQRQALLQSTLSGMTAADLAATNPDLAKQVQQRSVEEMKASRATQAEANPSSTSKRRRKAKTDDYTDSNEFFNDTDF